MCCATNFCFEVMHPDAMPLDAKLDFVADFCLPSLVASSQPLRLPNTRWELGMSIQIAMVKSLVQMVTHL